ncbi:MAG: PIG-L deacetylase family protein [Marinobacter sp.]
MQSLAISTERPLNILCLGAHCDDIEIGCGGTILELSAQREVNCTWVVFCSNDERAREARDCAESFLSKTKKKDIWINDFKDGFLPYFGGQAKDYFEEIKSKICPDLIFTHYREDKHQDHRFISELTLNTFRDHLILEYEIPKYDGDMCSPNCFFEVSRESASTKIKNILDNYKTQNKKKWFTEDLFMALMRIRGMESNSSSSLSEAFYGNKIVITNRSFL